MNTRKRQQRNDWKQFEAKNVKNVPNLIKDKLSKPKSTS